MITIISAVAIGLADYSLQLPGPYSQLLMTGGGRSSQRFDHWTNGLPGAYDKLARRIFIKILS